MLAQDSVHSRVLAARLKAMRHRAGLTGGTAAAELRWSPSKISRIEHCDTGISLRDLDAALALYKPPPAEREAVLDLAGRLSGHPLDDYAEAVLTLQWTVTAFPAPAQAEAYARAVLHAAQPLDRRPPSEIEAAVRDAALRQQRMTGEPAARQLQLCFDESVLLRRYGDQAVMAAQLSCLHDLAGQAGADIRMLPLGTEAVRPPGFALLCFASPAVPGLPPAVAVDHLGAPWTSCTEADAFRYQLAFSHLQSLALDREQTRAAIARVLRTPPWS